MRTPNIASLRPQTRVDAGPLGPLELVAAFDDFLATTGVSRPSVQTQQSLFSTAAQSSPTAKTATDIRPEDYTEPFLSFINDNPTVFHAVNFFSLRLESEGFKKLSERDNWTSVLQRGGKYYTARNGSALIAFTVPENYQPGNGVGIIAGHIDALTAKLKPVSTKPTSHGYVQLGVAPYAGALNSTWWDRDLGIGGRVILKSPSGKIESKLVKLEWPIAKIPTLAPHFGVAAHGPFNQETQMVPIIGLERSVGFFAASNVPHVE